MTTNEIQREPFFKFNILHCRIVNCVMATQPNTGYSIGEYTLKKQTLESAFALMCIINMIHTSNKPKVNCSNATLMANKNINNMHMESIAYYTHRWITWSELHKVYICKPSIITEKNKTKQEECFFLVRDLILNMTLENG